MKEFLKLIIFSGLFLGMFLFWAAQCSGQSTFTRDKINTTTFTVLGSEKMFFSTDSTPPAVGYIKLWARDSTTLYLIRSSGVKVNLLSSAMDTSVLATQYDISLKSVAFGTIDTAGLAVNKILKWNGSSWTIRDDSLGAGTAADSTTWIATDYDVSLKLASADTASLSSRINLKLTATDTASLSSRINTKLAATDTASLSSRIDTKLAAVDTASLSTRINLKLAKTDTASLSSRIDTKLAATDTASLSSRIDTKLGAADTVSLSQRINTKLPASDTTGFRAYSTSLYLGQSLIDTTGKALGAVLKWNGAKWVDSTDETGAGGTLIWGDTSNALATDYDVSLKLNSAAIDTSVVLSWSDTTSSIATQYDIPVNGIAYIRSSVDTLAITVSSVSRVLASWADSRNVSPLPVSAYVLNSTTIVLKPWYDLTLDSAVVHYTYWR